MRNGKEKQTKKTPKCKTTAKSFGMQDWGLLAVALKLAEASHIS